MPILQSSYANFIYLNCRCRALAIRCPFAALAAASSRPLRYHDACAAATAGRWRRAAPSSIILCGCSTSLRDDLSARQRKDTPLAAAINGARPPGRLPARCAQIPPLNQSSTAYVSVLHEGRHFVLLIPRIGPHTFVLLGRITAGSYENVTVILGRIWRSPQPSVGPGSTTGMSPTSPRGRMTGQRSTRCDTCTFASPARSGTVATTCFMDLAASLHTVAALQPVPSIAGFAYVHSPRSDAVRA